MERSGHAPGEASTPALERSYLYGAHDDHVLREPLLELLPVLPPPLRIEGLDHHLEHDHLVGFDASVIATPQAGSGRPDVGGDAAESSGQCLPYRGEVVLGKAPAGIVEYRQENLDQVHGYFFSSFAITWTLLFTRASAAW